MKRKTISDIYQVRKHVVVRPEYGNRYYTPSQDVCLSDDEATRKAQSCGSNLEYWPWAELIVDSDDVRHVEVTHVGITIIAMIDDPYMADLTMACAGRG